MNKKLESHITCTWTSLQAQVIAFENSYLEGLFKKTTERLEEMLRPGVLKGENATIDAVMQMLSLKPLALLCILAHGASGG